MWLRDPLTDILSSPAKVALLRVLCEVPGPLSGREAIRRARVSYGPGWKALQSLAASGALSVKQYGRVKTYELRDRELPLMRRLRGLFAEEKRRQRQVARQLAERIPKTEAIVPFGSEARGEARAGSDTDLLIVVTARKGTVEARVREACLEIAGRHDLALSWHLTDPDEVRKWEAGRSGLWHGVLRDGLTIYGRGLETLTERWRTGAPT